MRRTTVSAVLATGLLAAAVPSYAVGAGAVECLVSGQRSGGSMSLRITCDGAGGTLASPWDATATWSGDVDSPAGGSGSVTLTGLFGGYAGPCAVHRVPPARYWAFHCTVTDGHQSLSVRWGVAESASGTLLGEGSMYQAATTGGPPAGFLCDFTTANGFLGEETYTGTISGGPLVAPGSSISIRCSIHTTNNQHTAPAAVAVSAGPERDVVVLEPREVSFPVGPFDTAVLCTEATVDGTTWYRTTKYGYSYWTTDGTEQCQWITLEAYPTPEDYVLWHAYEVVDSFLCPVLEVAFEGGDVAGLWNCPPY